uniref:Uncharacterized protein n=1 Tax=Agrobacterium tumefaciens TaxID=358 RepID=A0A5B9T468_AGRTU|nr:hypothetical protein AgrTiT37_00102 [Agrobacterium tumefaciens]
MEGFDISAGGFPDRLVTNLGEEAQPNHDVIAVGAQRMTGTNSVERQVEKEAINVGVIQFTPSQNTRHIGIEPVGGPPLFERDL